MVVSRWRGASRGFAVLGVVLLVAALLAPDRGLSESSESPVRGVPGGLVLPEVVATTPPLVVTTPAIEDSFGESGSGWPDFGGGLGERSGVDEVVGHCHPRQSKCRRLFGDFGRCA